MTHGARYSPARSTRAAPIASPVPSQEAEDQALPALTAPSASGFDHVLKWSSTVEAGSPSSVTSDALSFSSGNSSANAAAIDRNGYIGSTSGSTSGFASRPAVAHLLLASNDSGSALPVTTEAAASSAFGLDDALHYRARQSMNSRNYHPYTATIAFAFVIGLPWMAYGPNPVVDAAQLKFSDKLDWTMLAKHLYVLEWMLTDHIIKDRVFEDFNLQVVCPNKEVWQALVEGSISYKHDADSFLILRNIEALISSTETNVFYCFGPHVPNVALAAYQARVEWEEIEALEKKSKRALIAANRMEVENEALLNENRRLQESIKGTEDEISRVEEEIKSLMSNPNKSLANGDNNQEVDHHDQGMGPSPKRPRYE